MDLQRKQPVWPFMRVVGKKAFLAFYLVTLLVVAILAATNVVSKYALKSYTEDQIQRIHLDSIAYQTSEITTIAEVKNQLSQIEGVRSVVDAGSIKLGLGTYMHVNIEGESTNIPWFMMLYSENPELLPVELRPEEGQTLTALVGPQAMVSPYLDKISLGDSVGIFYEDPLRKGQGTQELFSTRIERLTTPERLNIVKFFLDTFGSAAFVPDGTLILVTPQEMFDRELVRITNVVHELSKPQPILGSAEEGAGQTEPEEENMGAMMIGEFMHLISVDRGALVTGWDLDGSYQRVSRLVGEMNAVATAVSYDSFINSELLVTVEKMAQVSRMIGLLTVLIAFPMLWLAWLFAGSLANLIILNQRRLVGLLRLRGASYGPIRTSLLLAIGAAGILGGLSGALLGTAVPYVLYRASGETIPLNLLFTTVQEPWVLAVFILLGTGFGLVAGRKVTGYMSQITPLEASRRVASSEESEFRYQLTKFQILCLILGGAKILAWSVGFTPQTAMMTTADNLLNFVGAALFLYGFAALIVSRRKRLESILSALAYPLALDLRWYAVRSMLVRPHRVMTVILVAGLTFGVVVYPQITSSSFYNKTVRALRLNLGASIAVKYDATTLTGGEVALRPAAQTIQSVQEKLGGLQEKLRALDGVQSVGLLYELAIPGSFYIPGQNYLQLYLIESPEQFLEKVYYEDELGIGEPFSDLMRGLGKNEVLVSRGFTERVEPGNGNHLGLGLAGDQEVEAEIAGAIHLLPGISESMTQDRESFSSASVDFLNSISRTHPYVVARSDAEQIGKLDGFLANVVVHVQGDGNEVDLARQVTKLRDEGAIPPFNSISTEEEERNRLSSDMFVYLALENIKVFMIGGILVALAGLIAIAIVNFIEGKRTFSLLRLRGASQKQLIRVILADLVAPLAVGAGIGVPVGLITGYGLTNAIFALPRGASILEILPVYLSLDWLVGAIVLGVLAFFFLAALLLSSWIFKRTAREALGA